MKPSNRSRSYYKKALIDINNAYGRISQLEESLNFRSFGDRKPRFVVTDSPDSYGISLYWNDVIIDMDSVFEALDNHLRITPRVLEDLICNINK